MATNSTVVTLLSKNEQKFEIPANLLARYTRCGAAAFKAFSSEDITDIIEYITHHGDKELGIEANPIDEKTTLESRLDAWDCKWILGLKNQEYTTMFEALEALGMDICILKLTLSKAIRWANAARFNPKLLAEEFAKHVKKPEVKEEKKEDIADAFAKLAIEKKT